MEFFGETKPTVVSGLGSAGTAGRVVRLSTDQNLYFDNGTEWVNLSSALVVVTRTGTALTLSTTEKAAEVRLTNADAKTVTLDQTSVLGTNFVCTLVNLGAGPLTISDGGVVTLRGNIWKLQQYERAILLAIGTDEYLIVPQKLDLVATLTDAATVAIDPLLGEDFYLSTAASRTLGAPGTAGRDMQTMIVRWKNTAGGDITTSLTTGSAGAFRYPGSITALNPTPAGASESIVAQYHAADQRWDVIGYSGFEFPGPTGLTFIDTKLTAQQAAIDGKDVVLSGLAVTAQGSPDMTVAVAKGSVLTNGVLKAVAAANGTITTADATNPRFDLVVINSSGAIAVRAGTPAINPVPPARSANDVIIAIVYVPANDTTISTGQITDVRVTRTNGPILIHKIYTAETTNNTASAVHILDKPNSGVVIPNGLLLAGRMLRCRIGGNLLMNSGTPTFTIIISYGGTTMFQDVSGTTTADGDRFAFFFDFLITAQGNADQTLSGILSTSGVGSKTAPTTGIGDFSATNFPTNPISGAATVDSDTADRTLSVTLTMSVANAANEIVTEMATLELL